MPVTMAQILTDVLTFIKHGNWMELEDYYIFGWNEYVRDEGTPDAELPVDENSAEMAASIAQTAWRAKTIYLSKEQAPDHFIEVLSQYRGEDEFGLEFAIASDLVKRLPQILKRHRLLDILVVDSPITGEPLKYFREATVCFCLGLNIASVLLCRSAFELILEQKLAQGIPHFTLLEKPVKKGRLEWWVDLGSEYGFLKDERKDDFTRQAHELRRFANNVIHKGKSPSESQTRAQLETLRLLARVIMQSK